jgi:hypothetical protein
VSKFIGATNDQETSVSSENDGTQIVCDVWCNVLSETGAGFQPFGFAGGLYDATTNLVRFGARDYDVWNGGNPVVVLEDSWLAFGNAGLTLGHVVALQKDRISDRGTYQHELAHVEQHDVLGPTYLQSHIAAQIWSLSTTGTYEQANLLEQGPYCSTPKPWWW